MYHSSVNAMSAIPSNPDMFLDTNWNNYLLKSSDFFHIMRMLNTTAAQIIGEGNLFFAVSSLASYDSTPNSEESIFGFFADTKISDNGITLREAVEQTYWSTIPDDCFVYFLNPESVAEFMEDIDSLETSQDALVGVVGSVIFGVMMEMSEYSESYYRRSLAALLTLSGALPFSGEEKRKEWFAFTMDEFISAILNEETTVEDLYNHNDFTELEGREPGVGEIIRRVVMGDIVAPKVNEQSIESIIQTSMALYNETMANSGSLRTIH